MDARLQLYLIYFLVFFGLLALADALRSFWAGINVKRRLKVSRRLLALFSTKTPEEAEINVLRESRLSEIPELNQVLQRFPHLQRRRIALEQAGLTLNVAGYLLIQCLLAFTVFILLRALTPGYPLLLLLIAVCAGFGLPFLYVKRKRAQRLQRFTELLPDTMDYIARSMRAGNPFTASLKSASQEMPEPIASELRATFEEMNFGIDLEQALSHLRERTESEELRYFITAVLIQRSTGGNLAEVLTRIASVMRGRAAMKREIIAISAEMNYSAKVLIALPFFMALILSVLNPEYLHVLIEYHIGIVILIVQTVLMAMGWYVIRQMINFRV